MEAVVVNARTKRWPVRGRGPRGVGGHDDLGPWAGSSSRNAAPPTA